MPPPLCNPVSGFKAASVNARLVDRLPVRGRILLAELVLNGSNLNLSLAVLVLYSPNQTLMPPPLYNPVSGFKAASVNARLVDR
jgi:hypothetical protein